MSDAETIIIYVCADCGMPVESEPCKEHQPAAYLSGFLSCAKPGNRWAQALAHDLRAPYPFPVESDSAAPPTSSDEERETLIAEAVDAVIRENEPTMRVNEYERHELVTRLAAVLRAAAAASNPWPNLHERCGAAAVASLGDQLRPEEITERVRVALGNAFAVGALWQYGRVGNPQPQRPVWEVQAEALEAAGAAWQQKALDEIGFSGMLPVNAWLRERAAELRRSGAPAHSHAPDTGMWAGCQACTNDGRTK